MIFSFLAPIFWALSLSFARFSLHFLFTILELLRTSYLELTHHSSWYLLSQSHYTTKLVAKIHMQVCKPIGTSYSVSSSNSSFIASAPLLYRNLIGDLQYLTLTHLNIAFVVNWAYQSMHNPSLATWAQLKHLLWYLKGTFTHGLLIHKISNLSLHVFNAAN